MSDAKYTCIHCDEDCERVPYPAGQRWLCGSCGEEYYTLEARQYRADQRKQLHDLMETINKTSEEH